MMMITVGDGHRGRDSDARTRRATPTSLLGRRVIVVRLESIGHFGQKEALQNVIYELHHYQ